MDCYFCALLRGTVEKQDVDRLSKMLIWCSQHYANQKLQVSASELACLVCSLLWEFQVL